MSIHDRFVDVTIAIALFVMSICIAILIGFAIIAELTQPDAVDPTYTCTEHASGQWHCSPAVA